MESLFSQWLHRNKPLLTNQRLNYLGSNRSRSIKPYGKYQQQKISLRTGKGSHFTTPLRPRDSKCIRFFLYCQVSLNKVRPQLFSGLKSIHTTEKGEERKLVPKTCGTQSHRKDFCKNIALPFPHASESTNNSFCTKGQSHK